MQKVAVEPPDWTIGEDVLVHYVTAPSRMVAMKKPQVPVRIPFAVAKPASEKAIAPWHHVRVATRRGERRPNAVGERWRDTFVGVQGQNPIVGRLCYREILLRPKSEPRLLDDACAAAASNFYGIIDAAGIDDDHLRGKT